MYPLFAISMSNGIFALIALVIIALAVWLILREIRKVPDDLARTPGTLVGGVADASVRFANGLADTVKRFFNCTPEVTVNNQVICEQSYDILELGTAARHLRHRKEFKDTWMGSEKVLVYSAVFLVKAGYDLTKPFRIKVDGLRARVVIGEPRVLSVEEIEFKVEADEDGWWNKVKPGERERLKNDLTKEARELANTCGLLVEAKSSFENRLRDAAAEKRGSIDFEYLNLAAA